MVPLMLSFSIAVVAFFFGLVNYLIICVVGVLLFLTLRSEYLLLAMIVIGVGFGLYWVSSHQPHDAPQCLNNHKQPIFFVSGKILTIPRYQYHATKFTFKVNKVNQSPCQTQLLLRWYGYHRYLQVDDHWTLAVKLKSKHSVFGKSNYAEWLKWHGITAQGYVKAKRGNYLLSRAQNFQSIDVVRQHLSQTIHHSVENHALAATLIALTTGSRHLMRKPEWTVFQNTGTSHLIAISGLHVSLVAGLFFVMVSFCWRYAGRLTLFIPAEKMASIIALIAALLYALLAGFSIPTQRALIMIFIALSGNLLYRNIPLWYRLLTAFSVVVFCWPLAIKSISFWLSFTAVFMIGWCCSGRLQGQKGLKSWLNLQLLLFIGLMPLTLLFFHRISLVMVIANYVAIPYMSFIVVPLCLLASILFFLPLHLSHYIWLLAAKSLSPLWWYLTELSDWPFAVWHYDIHDAWVFLSLAIGALLLLMPKGFPGRMLAIIFFLPLLIST